MSFNILVDISNDVQIDFGKYGNAMIMGHIGSGKTYLMSFILGNLFLKFGGNIKFYGIDPKGLELTSTLKSMGMVSGNSGKEIFQVVHKVENEMMVRYQKLRNRDISEGFDNSYPPIFLIIDELIFIKSFLTKGLKTVTDQNKAVRDFMNILERISVMGRQCHVFVIVASQYLNTDYLPLSISENLLNRILLGSASRQDIQQCFGQSYNISGKSGYCLFQNPDYQEPFQFIPYRFELNQMIREIKRKRERM